MSNDDAKRNKIRQKQDFSSFMSRHMTSLFGDEDEPEEEEDERIPRSPFVLNGLPAEPHEGNIEYKLKLVEPNPDRLEHLITQMNWRLREGQGEALYEIGVEDSGSFTGVDEKELVASLNTLKTMATRLTASITILHKKLLENGRYIVEVLVRKVPDDQDFIDLRVAVLGTLDSGKSSIVGVCTHGELDNGRGRARLNLFRHPHEIQTGRTSSITQEILGFNDEGKSIDYGCCRTAKEICQQSTKIITFSDLAGHVRYLRTTLFGLCAHAADFAMLCVDAPSSVVETTREHFSYAIALEVPVFVVITKIDLCSEKKVEETVETLTKLLEESDRRTKLRAVFIQRREELLEVADTLIEKNICPIFAVSSLTGKNIDLLKDFLNIIPPRLAKVEQENLAKQSVEFQIDEIYANNSSEKQVVGGILRSGTIHENENFLIGPLQDERFIQCKVTSIHRYRVPRQSVSAGQAASLSLVLTENVTLRKGMVLVCPSLNPEACTEFVAKIYLSMHHTNASIRRGFETTVQIQNIRQTVTIVEMDVEPLRVDQEATVTFRFRNRCEYLVLGSRFIFRSGHQTKGSGTVIKLHS